MTPKPAQIGERKALALRVGHSDHRLEQAWRNETHAVYKHFGSYGQYIGWEAIRIKVKKAETVFGKDYPEREVYPGTSDFGRWAVSVPARATLEEAIERAVKL